MTVIGLISGTSYDAVDAAAARLRLEGGTLFLVPLGLHSVPIPAPLRAPVTGGMGGHRRRDCCRFPLAAAAHRIRLAAVTEGVASMDAVVSSRCVDQQRWPAPARCPR